MATTTSNFSWPIPQSTDLVKDGATAIASLGSGIDTSMADLKGGTTGQILSKASNTDMDFTWVSDATGMTNPMTTTGDTIYSSSGSTPARLGIGSSGQVLTVSGGVPTWATPSSGGFTSIASGTLSGSSVTISSIASTYKHLAVTIHSAYNSLNDEVLYMRFNSDSGTNYNYYGITVSGTFANDSSVSQTSFQIAPLGNNNSATYYSNGLAWIYNYTNTTRQTVKISGSGRTGASVYKYKEFLGSYSTSSAISSITLLTSAGTFSGGTYVVYGVN